MAIKKKHGIFCFEGEWSPNLKDESSMRTLLQFLKQNDQIDFIFRDIGTIEELKFYIRKWKQKAYKKYNIGYFAFHGRPGHLQIGRKELSLGELGDLLEGACKGKVLLFDSCATLGVGKKQINKFISKTKARCVCGYKKDVYWFPSAALVILLLSTLNDFTRMDAVERRLMSYRDLTRKLGFEMHWRR